MDGISAGLCSGAKPGRVSLVSLEAARITELLPADFLATEPLCQPSFASDAQANYFGHRILGTVATVLMSLYYVGLDSRRNVEVLRRSAILNPRHHVL